MAPIRTPKCTLEGENRRRKLSMHSMTSANERRSKHRFAIARDVRYKMAYDGVVVGGVPLCWEDVVHANALRLNEIIDKRRMILRDMELTPEMQTKRKKALGNVKPVRFLEPACR